MKIRGTVANYPTAYTQIHENIWIYAEIFYEYIMCIMQNIKKFYQIS